MSTLGAEHGWTMTRHATKALLSHLIRTDVRIGTPSTFGVVHKVLVDNGNDCQFVMKTIRIPRQVVTGFSLNFNTLRTKINRNNNRNTYLNRIGSFQTEVKIGSLKNIGLVGPRVYAWRITPTGAEYIMDNVLLGDQRAKVYPFSKVYKNEHILKLALDAIKLFQQITKGYHGDLHKNNIQVVVTPEKVVYVMIIDYGSWRPASVNKNLGQFITMHHGLNVYRPGGRGTPFIKNNNMIKRILADHKNGQAPARQHGPGRSP
jgi:hypothetical protein